MIYSYQTILERSLTRRKTVYLEQCEAISIIYQGSLNPGPEDKQQDSLWTSLARIKQVQRWEHLICAKRIQCWVGYKRYHFRMKLH